MVGTLWNSIGIGMSLFAICQIEAFGVQDINLQENLLFASIISAVDPVAVLSVFEDVSVNEQLYIVVFGECLFNDAVTVVSVRTQKLHKCVGICRHWLLRNVLYTKLRLAAARRPASEASGLGLVLTTCAALRMMPLQTIFNLIVCNQ